MGGFFLSKLKKNELFRAAAFASDQTPAFERLRLFSLALTLTISSAFCFCYHLK